MSAIATKQSGLESLEFCKYQHASSWHSPDLNLTSSSMSWKPILGFIEDYGFSQFRFKYISSLCAILKYQNHSTNSSPLALDSTENQKCLREPFAYPTFYFLMEQNHISEEITGGLFWWEVGFPLIWDSKSIRTLYNLLDKACYILISINPLHSAQHSC